MIDDDDIADLLAERRGRRAHMRELAQHPDNRDPDHPEPFDEGTEAERVAAEFEKDGYVRTEKTP
jgi:hypothetical protein